MNFSRDEVHFHFVELAHPSVPDNFKQLSNSCGVGITLVQNMTQLANHLEVTLPSFKKVEDFVLRSLLWHYEL